MEDAVSGVQAAKTAGMICIAVTASFTAEKLYNAGADYIMNDLTDAADIIYTIASVY